MKIEPFLLERFFARHEFTARYLMSASDCETLSLPELVGMASPEGLKLWQGLRLGYTETMGHPLLREEVARLYQSIRPEDVMIAIPEEAIFILMLSMLGPEDHAVVVTPAYQSLYEVARAAGCRVTRVNLRPGPDGWRLDLDELRRGLEPHTRLLVLNAPHNPTGYLPAWGEFDALVEIARARGLYLLGDEMYRFLEHDPGRRLPAVCDAYEKGISLAGLSKSFGLAGLRIGWLATRETALLERWVRLKDYTSICGSAPSEVLGIIALGASERIVGRNRAIVLENLAAAREFFRARPDLFTWIEPQAGSVAFPVWRGPGPVETFCRKLLDERGVVLVPGSLFEFPGNHFRVGLGRRDFGEGLAQVAAAYPR